MKPTESGMARCGEVELAYESFGDPRDPAVLLVMGLGGQMIRWDEVLCGRLADGGLRVVRFDNRDVGHSTKLDACGVPDVGAAFAALGGGEPYEPPYRLDDMADDVVHLMDALDIEAAHVVGTSMGGMIAQLVALRHRARTRSLTSLMSTTGERGLPPPTAEAMRHLMTREPEDREGYVAHHTAGARRLGGSRPFDEDYARQRAAVAWDRCFHPQGVVRQLVATSCAPGRADALAALDLPTLVLHGDEDPLVPLGCGRATAEAVPGSRLWIVEGMGHDLRPSVRDDVVEAIAWRVDSA